MESVKSIIEITTFFTVIIGIIVGVIKLYLINKKIRLQYEWKVREMSLKYSSLYHPHVSRSKGILQREFNLLGRRDAIPLSDILKSIESNNEIQIHLNNLLTYFENISLACLKGVANENIIFDMCGKNMVVMRKRLINYINHHRDISGNERLWKELDNYANIFEKKLNNPGIKLDKLK